MREGQRVCRHIDLRNDLHTVLLRQFLEVDKLLLRVRTVLSRQPGIRIALQSEGCLRLVPVVGKIAREAVVVEVYLQSVHLVIGHHLDQIAQIAHGNKLTSAINHEATHGIAGLVDRRAARNGTFRRLLRKLQQRTRGPEKALFRSGRDTGRLTDVHGISLFAEFSVFSDREHEIAFLPLAGDNRHLYTGKSLVVCNKTFCNFTRHGVTFGHDYPPGRNKLALGTGPCGQFGNDKGLRIDIGINAARKGGQTQHGYSQTFQ